MRPSPIPDEDVWPGAIRKVIAGPDGDLTGDIRPVEALIDLSGHVPRFCLRIVLDDGDLDELAREGHFWLTMTGDHLHPFSVAMPSDRVED